jgi:phospho-N-acetylmuramoyl-pentapeptide-transferase
MSDMLIKIIASFVIAFVISSLIGLVLIPFLKRIRAGQAIRDDGPVWHSSKAGTPTMGGLMFIIGSAAAILITGLSPMLAGDYRHIFVLLFALVFGAIGFLDDFEKLRKKQNMGLKATQKFLLQLVVAIAFTFLLRYAGYLSTALYIPFANITVRLPEVVYLALAAFVIVGTVNAVNITDGVDGLATGTSIPVCVCYAVVAVKWGTAYLSMGIAAAAVTGGLLGFLIYNYNPAKIFMGDTGSLFLGGIICAMAFAMDMPLLLITLGIVFLLETISDIIQIFYFKLTHGKRFFKMAPLHHHLELGGFSGKKWREKQLFLLFFIVSALFAVISYIGVMDRF